MKSFRNYLSENKYFDYGKPKEPGHNLSYFGDEAKITASDPIIQHFARTGLLRKHEEARPPSEEETHKEINDLMDRIRTLSPEDKDFALRAEVDEPGMYHKFAQSIGLNLPNGYVQKIFDKTDPILLHLKRHHNRSRPEQFARANGIHDFKTSIPHDVTHAAYPSGHSLDAYIMNGVFRTLKPQHSQAIDDFTRRMSMSRLNAGVHYISDVIAAYNLGKDILSQGLITVTRP